MEGSKLVGAIDVGTGSSRFLVFNENLELKFSLKEKAHRKELGQHSPKEGWLEQDPMELLESVRLCIGGVADSLRLADTPISSIHGVGITNQRETTILWDRLTGVPFYNAIVWSDNRTRQLADTLIASTPNDNKDYLRPKCGLPIHPYFSALKIRWLIDNVEEVRTAVASKTCLFGTVDSWIIWNLTGGVSGGCHVTDVTNASRTMLMDLQTCKWDTELCSFFGIPMSILPEIRSSSEVYGRISEGPLKGIPISGCLGDQQAALVGQRCFKKGDAKNTYGTGCFLLYNTGLVPVRSSNGLLTTVAYKMGPEADVHYALEGSVAMAGQCVRWLRDNMKFFTDAEEIERLAESVHDTAGVYFVPAFSGLYAPHWQSDARGLIIGLSSYTNKGHISRATLEAVCFQSREILEAMNQDSELPLASLKVDGGMTVNKLLLQLQADLLGIPVEKEDMSETTVLGAAIAAGIGVGVWPNQLDSIPQSMAVTLFNPSIDHDSRDSRYYKWKEAVKRCMHWEGNEKEIQNSGRWRRERKVGVVGVGVAAAVLAAAFLIYWRRH